jgi:hypothetical protein
LTTLVYLPRHEDGSRLEEFFHEKVLGGVAALGLAALLLFLFP